MNGKIDKLLSEGLEKDKQMASLEHKTERDAEMFERKNNELTINITHITRERDQFSEKYEFNKAKLSEMQDDSMQHRLESGRE